MCIELELYACTGEIYAYNSVNVLISCHICWHSCLRIVSMEEVSLHQEISIQILAKLQN